MPVKLSEEFNGTSLWRNKSWAIFCPECGLPTNQWTARYEEVRKPTIRADLSLSADGIEVASKKFKQFYEETGLQGLEFVPLNNGFFGLRLVRQVRYDSDRFNTHQEDWCDTCRRFKKHLVRSEIPILDPDEEPISANEFVCSEMEFGDQRLRCRDLLVGDDVHAWIADKGFKRLGYQEVQQPSGSAQKK